MSRQAVAGRQAGQWGGGRQAGQGVGTGLGSEEARMRWVGKERAGLGRVGDGALRGGEGWVKGCVLRPMGSLFDALSSMCQVLGA